MLTRLSLFVAAMTFLNVHASNTRADFAYAIGNSLTWDTIPSGYATDWHVYCGRNLDYINSNPNSHCVPSSLPWTTALTTKSYDFVIVQPHFGTTLSQDTDIISNWIQMQPNATFVVHSGWSFHFRHESDYNAGMSTNMVHSPEYFSSLINNLHQANPGREIRFNPAIEVLEAIRVDIANGAGPFDALSDLYRDNIHMNYDSGYYLMHNLMRTTLGLEISDSAFLDVPIGTRDYLDSKILQVTAVPEPSSVVYCLAALPAYFLRKRRLTRTDRALQSSAA